MAHNHRRNLIIGIFACLVFSCEQFAIFEAIAVETKPKPALIKGTASKIVVDYSTNNLYVANGELWTSPAGGSWTKVSDAPPHTRDVAVAGAVIYVISVEKLPSLSKLADGKKIAPSQGTVQGIYGANDTLYVAVGVGDSYSVYTYDGNSFSSNAVAPGLLHGAAYYQETGAPQTGHYYLATDTGLYHSTDASSFTPVPDISEKNVLGVIALDLNLNSVVAVTASAAYMVSGNTVTKTVSSESLTGALAVSDNTLYLGRVRGYREVDDVSSSELKTPSMPSYASTIAQVRVISMFALSNDLIFASVLSSDPKRSGLMSYRNGSWNMEE